MIMSDRVLVAMSGGVDSSVAALLLTRAGYDCVGAMMKLFENEDIGESIEKSCCSLADRGDAELAAEKLDIPFYVFNYAEEFRRCVMDYFVEQYGRARTPNPCVACNRHLKFGALMERAGEQRCPFIATGHYARIERDGERFLLKRGVDAAKDQSYALYFMTPTQLAGTLFPLGGYTKGEVREIAAEFGLSNAKKRESQDICFVPDGDYAGFIEAYTAKPLDGGLIVDTDGRELGRHDGIARYTIGQRRGLGVSSSGRLYVEELDAARNRVVLGDGSGLWSKSLTARGVNLIAVDKLDAPRRVEAQIRYSHTARPATAYQEDEDTLRVVFDDEQRAITPGQHVVLYDGDVVIGGGTIADSGGV
jgi:tRNA-specific 2-thiouridylase